MKDFIEFSKHQEFNSFFVNNLILNIEGNINQVKENLESLGEIKFFSLRQSFNLICTFLLKFTFNSKDLSIESLKSYGSNHDLDSKLIDVVYPLFLANLDKIILLKNKENINFSQSEIINFKTNINVTYSHQNMFKVDKANLTLELITNKDLSFNKERNIYEFTSDELDQSLNELKEIYANIN